MLRRSGACSWIKKMRGIVCLRAIFRSYFFAVFFFFPLVFLGTILASNLILSIFYLNLCLSQNQRAPLWRADSLPTFIKSIASNLLRSCSKKWGLRDLNPRNLKAEGFSWMRRKLIPTLSLRTSKTCVQTTRRILDIIWRRKFSSSRFNS